MNLFLRPEYDQVTIYDAASKLFFVSITGLGHHIVYAKEPLEHISPRYAVKS